MDNIISPVGQTEQKPVGSEVVNPDASKEASVEANQGVKRETSNDFVKYENYKKVVDEKMKLKGRLQELEAEKEAREHKVLAETNNFKALYEKTNEKLKESDNKINELEGILSSGFMQNAVLDKLGEQGISCKDAEALFALGNDDLLQFTENDGIMGVDEFVDDAKKRMPYLFASQDIPKTNDLPPTFHTSQPITKENFTKLPKEEQQRILNNIRK